MFAEGRKLTMIPISILELQEYFSRLITRLIAVVSDYNEAADPNRQFRILRSDDNRVELVGATASAAVEVILSRQQIVVSFRPDRRHDSGLMTLHDVRTIEGRPCMLDENEQPMTMERFAAECIRKLRAWE